jgi:hypothetical protein
MIFSNYDFIEIGCSKCYNIIQSLKWILPYFPYIFFSLGPFQWRSYLRQFISQFVVQVNVNRDKFLTISPTRFTNFSNLFLEWNSACFRQFLCPSWRVFHCTHSNGICHIFFLTACEQDQDGTAVPSWSCSQAVSKTSFTYFTFCFTSVSIKVVSRWINQANWECNNLSVFI